MRTIKVIGVCGFIAMILLGGCESEPMRKDLRIDKKREDKILPTWKKQEKSWWEASADSAEGVGDESVRFDAEPAA